MFLFYDISIWILVGMMLTGVLMLSGILKFELFSDWNILFFSVTMDNSSFLFIILLLGVSMMIICWSSFYMSSNWKSGLFCLTLMMFIASMFLLLISNSPMLVFLGWEGLGVSSFLLILLYQNFMSVKGGLLTLLTNRVGDAFLLSCFVYWIVKTGSVSFLSSKNLMLIFMVVTITKSAQWPFSNWLPAAMAAPTPVSALVHSSTLVTAGVWLMIRFWEKLAFLMILCLLLGLVTLILASLAAMFELDGKKIVALSTLSQLGMMFITMSLGGMTVCLFHVITHALAKANLFMVVGAMLHKSYSEQDTRKLMSGGLSYMSNLSGIMSIFSLSGLVFMAGFFSKEQILHKMIKLMNSLLMPILMVLIASLTLTYCLKLMLLINKNYSEKSSEKTSYSQTFPIAVLATMSTICGSIITYNLMLSPTSPLSGNNLLWMMFIISILMMRIYMYSLFKLQGSILDIFKPMTWKVKLSTLEMSGTESMYLTGSLVLLKMTTLSTRNLMLISSSLLLLSFF